MIPHANQTSSPLFIIKSSLISIFIHYPSIATVQSVQTYHQKTPIISKNSTTLGQLHQLLFHIIQYHILIEHGDPGKRVLPNMFSRTLSVVNIKNDLPILYLIIWYFCHLHHFFLLHRLTNPPVFVALWSLFMMLISFIFLLSFVFHCCWHKVSSYSISICG